MGGIISALRLHRRKSNLLAAAACFALVGYAYYTQRYQALDPCPLCIFQRLAIMGLGLAFLVAAVLPSRPRFWGYFASLVVAAVALTGAGIATRHVYIQSLPPGQVPACGATLDYMWDVFPAMEVLRKVLTGSGECARIDWTFLGISMPGWVLIWALLLAGVGLVVNWPTRGSRAR
jgi:protein dithiol:quinone oxidoreductase